MTLKACLAAAFFAMAQPVMAVDYDFTPPAFPDDTGGQVFQYFMPASNGFAANVNLQIQPYEGSLEEYEALSIAQFEQLELEVVQTDRSDGELMFEYRGDMQGTEMHWYARVIQHDGLFYVVTATALAERWDEERDELTRSVQSFSLNN
ncbi:hypothetical protein ACR0ST_03765 [Aliidiomarina sp. Khilg15.8]